MAPLTWMTERLQGLDSDEHVSTAPLRPGIFPFRSLPSELRTAIFQKLFCKSDVSELAVEQIMRVRARDNLILMNKATYQELAPKLYTACCIKTYYDSELAEFMNDVLPTSSELFRQYIRHVNFHLGSAPSRALSSED